MKTYKNLYPQITDWHNLMLAWRKPRRGKRYTPAAASFARNLDYELLSLYHDLRDESYQPGEYVSFIVQEPKRRKISAAPFRDRVAHHAPLTINQLPASPLPPRAPLGRMLFLQSRCRLLECWSTSTDAPALLGL